MMLAPEETTRSFFSKRGIHDALLSKIIVSWTGWSCIEAFWRGSERAFQDEVGSSAPKAHETSAQGGA